MNRSLPALLATCALFAPMGGALAQSTVVIAPEVRTEVREYVVRRAPPPVMLPDSYSVTVGQPLPPEVEVYRFEEVPAASDYGYVVVENRTLVVDPVTREVIDVIE